MKNEFVPYPLALRMKALGFKERVLTYYENEVPKLYNGISGWDFNSSFLTCCSRPTYSQAFKWFREKYGYLHHITYFDPVKAQIPGEADYQGLVLFPHQDVHKLAKISYDTYEEAELACLEKLIEIEEERHQEEWDLYLKQKEDGKNNI